MCFQVEFSYPPLLPNEGHDSNLLPEEWKYLPFLALPDGAHNYQEGMSRLACRVQPLCLIITQEMLIHYGLRNLP